MAGGEVENLKPLGITQLEREMGYGSRFIRVSLVEMVNQ
jgi:hypothetical protein